MSTEEVIGTLRDNVNGKNGDSAKWVSNIIAACALILTITLPVIGTLLVKQQNDMKEQYNKVLEDVADEIKAAAAERRSMIERVMELERLISIHEANEYTMKDATAERVRVDDRLANNERLWAVVQEKLETLDRKMDQVLNK